MCPNERYTQRRGRAGVPSTRWRTRSCTRMRCRFFDSLRPLADATVSSPESPTAPLYAALEKLCRASGFRAGLAGLLLPLAGDTNALLFVRIGRTQRAKIRGHLPDFALVRAAHDDVRLFVHGDLNAFGNRKLDGMRFAERESHHFALELRAVADAHDVQILFEALRNALHGVGDKRAGQPVQRAMVLGFTRGGKHAVFLLELDAVRHRDNEFAFRPLHVHLAALQRDFHALRHGNWFASDT